MAKMIIALALAAPSALAFTHYVPNTDEPTPAPANGCGDPCADVITISSTSFPTIESDKCYVVDGTFPVIGLLRRGRDGDWWSGCWDGRW